jgi:hypothetical protein
LTRQKRGAIMHDINEIFSAFEKLSALVEETDKRKREEHRVKRNEKARLRYAIKKRAGLLVSKKEKERIKMEAYKEKDKYDYNLPTSCTCWQGHPPCSYCILYWREEG